MENQLVFIYVSKINLWKHRKFVHMYNLYCQFKINFALYILCNMYIIFILDMCWQNLVLPWIDIRQPLLLGFHFCSAECSQRLRLFLYSWKVTPAVVPTVRNIDLTTKNGIMMLVGNGITNQLYGIITTYSTHKCTNLIRNPRSVIHWGGAEEACAPTTYCQRNRSVLAAKNSLNN